MKRCLLSVGWVMSGVTALALGTLAAGRECQPAFAGEQPQPARDAVKTRTFHFAYTGGLEDGQPHTYHVQGANFIVQFLNVQDDSQKNPANHIHSAWRELPVDFGLR